MSDTAALKHLWKTVGPTGSDLFGMVARSVLLAVLVLSIGVFARHAVEAIADANMTRSIAVGPVLLLIAATLRVTVELWNRRRLATIGGRVEREVAHQLVESLFESDDDVLLNQPAGEIVSRLADANAIRNAFTNQLGSAVSSTLQTLALFAYLSSISVPIPLMCLGVGLVAGAFSLRAKGTLRRAFSISARYRGRVRGLIGSVLPGRSTIRGNGLAGLTEQRILTQTDRAVRCSVRSAHLQAGFRSLVDLTGSIGTVLVLVLAVSLAARGSISLGSLASIFAVGTQLIRSIGELTFLPAQYQPAAVAASRLIAAHIASADNSQDTCRSSAQEDQCPADTRSDLPAIRLVGVKLRHVQMQSDAMNLSVQHGRWLLVTGPSGVGKTTLLRSIAGDVLVQEGTIEVLGQAVETGQHGGRHERRSDIGFVPQDTWVYPGSIRDNVRCMRSYVTNQDVEAACETVGLLSETWHECEAMFRLVGDEGRNLSGGQLKRLSIARAIAGRPCILLLDEAFANLDEADGLSILENLRNGTFANVVGRLSTVVLCSHSHSVYSRFFSTSLELPEGILRDI